jgi:HEAT repeat protein
MEESIQDLVSRLRHCRTLPEIQEACSEVEKEADLTSLLTEVLGSDEISVRWKAAVALTELGSPAVDTLIACLSDPRACVRSSAAWVLGNIGDARAAPALQRLQEDPSADVRKEVAEAFGKLVDDRSRMAGKEEKAEV